MSRFYLKAGGVLNRPAKTMRGCRVELIDALQTKQLRIPADTVLAILNPCPTHGVRDGLELMGPKCSCCGIRPVLRGVPASRVRVIDVEPTDEGRRMIR